ncbi:MAG: hypothetical protein IJ589_03520 [Lachnospiraceae bacterium]|nr:hypothetical protein [Lachnospiraceae bacterium]
MKGFKWLTGIALAVAAMVVLPMTAHAAGKDMYCLYNSANKEFLYTIDENEKNNLISTWEYKGVICTLPDSSTTAVYRLYDPVSTQHLYTSDDAEISKLVGEGWTKEGIAYYVDDAHTAPVYRMFNPATGEHQFSGSNAHMSSLEAGGWVKEGVAYYALSVNEALTGGAVVPAVAYLNGQEVREDNYDSVFASQSQYMDLDNSINGHYWNQYEFTNDLVFGEAIFCNSEIRNEHEKATCTSGYEMKQTNFYRDPSGIVNMTWKGVGFGATKEQVKAVWGEPTYESSVQLTYMVGTTCYSFHFNFRNPALLGEVKVYFNCNEKFSTRYPGFR